MAYLFVFLSLLCGNIKGICGKKTSTFVQRVDDALIFSTMRMAICVVIGFLMFISDTPDWQNVQVEGGMMAICVFAGIANAMFIICWMLAVRKTAMVTMDVALTVGSLIPAVLGAFMFGEEISWQKMIGFAFILLAVIVLSSYNKTAKGKMTVGAILLVVASAVGEGLSSFSQQLYKHYYTAEGLCYTGVEYTKTLYHFYTYVYVAVTLVFALAIYHLAHQKRPAEKSGFATGNPKDLIKPFIYIAIMAACLFGASYFQTVATNDYAMPSQILYPILKGGALILTAVTAMIFFGEKITKRSVLGIILAIIGTVAMNIL